MSSGCALAGLEHPLEHRDRQPVHLPRRRRCRPARRRRAPRRPARIGPRRRRPAGPRSNSRPARTAARRRGARLRPPESPPPPRSCWAGGHPARNPGFETAATSRRPSKPRAKRVNSWGPAVAITDGRQMRIGLLRALGETEDRRRLGLGVAEAEPGAKPAPPPPPGRRRPRAGRAGAPAGTWSTAAGAAPCGGGGATAAVASRAPSSGSAAPPFAPVARNARLEVADQRGGGRMVEDERGRQIQPGERLQLVAQLEGDEGIDAQLDEGDLRIEPRRRVVPERSRHRRADGIG